MRILLEDQKTDVFLGNRTPYQGAVSDGASLAIIGGRYE